MKVEKYIFPAVILFISIIILTLGMAALIKTNRVKEWPQTEGTVIKTDVTKITRTSSSPSYRPIVVYEYKVKGSSYINSGISIVQETEGKRKKAESRIRDFPIGSRVMVYYNPDNPEVSYLNASLKSILISLFPAGLILFIIGSSIILYKMKRNRN